MLASSDPKMSSVRIATAYKLVPLAMVEDGTRLRCQGCTLCWMQTFGAFG